MDLQAQAHHQQLYLLWCNPRGLEQSIAQSHQPPHLVSSIHHTIWACRPTNAICKQNPNVQASYVNNGQSSGIYCKKINDIYWTIISILFTKVDMAWSLQLFY